MGIIINHDDTNYHVKECGICERSHVPILMKHNSRPLSEIQEIIADLHEFNREYGKILAK